MGQKVHPIGFRIGVTQTHRSQWFAKPKDYAKLVEEDLLIREFAESRLPDAGISRINISRQVDRIEIEFFTARPRALVGAKGETLTQLRDEIKAKLPDTRNVALYVTKTQQPEMEAICIAENIAEQLEKRTPFRRTMRQAIMRARKAGAEGIKIQISGRLNGAEIARHEWAREGRVPLHTIRADIDYATARAQTIYGILGIKVWVCKGEKSC
ncbi:ribosomal protein S3 (chloroplast) [Ostreococcus tauri]|uniref:Small ribosomal subunit protein uS3c n=2 Tax=Ostreococcus tauri TaxID=70448 RepID=RR3_OSTTA|nr:ribosomal protein S3 [Ostreococcus tauri]Q0P3L7.1 RecName: Full=Small ribosomal subunit protein uS3c; AltName: Full=30S ribosomal protein S3, chloroplastic [Ostreococcus tauri]AGR88209.1 ribosomal protein S3 [Ostreococcus tauri]AGW30511.1 ribosomal protein S3 [Ostreococcus tauri]AGW30572.1 ribosomal protein S3 [Ostreococcus tauri]AGW30633.1 ribosomal protein S3 [Ostreococcus tauri]AGW30694.1 ribosomal protein S3 [Ostreococcus tauri]|eukprot:YP_717238.1 Rps3 (chloroplast) [Ostreococcus tauri]